MSPSRRSATPSQTESEDAGAQLLAQLQQLVAADLTLERAACARLRLSPHQGRTVIFLAQRPGATIGDLAKGIGVSLGWASRIVEELVQCGQVRTGRGTTDRRVVHVELVEDARRVVEQLLDGRRALVSDTANALPSAQQRALSGVLGTLAAGLDRLATPEAVAAPS